MADFCQLWDDCESDFLSQIGEDSVGLLANRVPTVFSNKTQLICGVAQASVRVKARGDGRLVRKSRAKLAALEVVFKARDPAEFVNGLSLFADLIVNYGV